MSNFDRGLYTPPIGESPKGYTRNRTYHWQSNLDTDSAFAFQYNRYGFRDKEWKTAKSQETDRILFIGDSFVESVMADSTLTQYFESSLDADNVEVLNAGMLGTGISRYLRLMSDMVPMFKPNVVIMVVYANDFMYDEIVVPTHYLEPEYYHPFKPRAIELFQQWRDGKAVPFRFWQKPEPFFFNPDSVIKGFILIHKQFKNTEYSTVLDAIARKGLNPARFNELHREEKYLKRFMDLRLPVDYFNYYAQQFDFDPMIVFIPSRNQLTENYKEYEVQLCPLCKDYETLMHPRYNQHQIRLASICDSLGIPFLDMSHTLQNEEKTGNKLFWNFDGHLNDEGTRLVGKTISSFYQIQQE